MVTEQSPDLSPTGLSFVTIITITLLCQSLWLLASCSFLDVRICCFSLLLLMLRRELVCGTKWERTAALICVATRRSDSLLVNDRAAEVYRTVGVSLEVFLSCCALWFALWSHGVTGTVGQQQQQQQRRACYRASMLCFHSYATAG